MVARVAVASDFSLDTEPTTIGVSGIQFGDRNQKIKPGEAVDRTAVSRGQEGST